MTSRVTADTPPQTGSVPPVARRRRRTALLRDSTRSDKVLPYVGIAIALVCWWALSALGPLGKALPGPGETLSALMELLTTAVFWDRLGETLGAWVVGFGAAVLVGIPLGIMVGVSRFVEGSVHFVFEFLRPIPPVAVIPLAVLVIGTGADMRAYLVAFAALWPIVYNTIYGTRDVDPVTRDTAIMYGVKGFSLHRHLTIPTLLPYVVTGIRLSATIGLIVEVAIEIIAGSDGIGYLMNSLATAGDVPGTYAVIFVAGVLGLTLTAVFRFIETRLLHWHASQRPLVP
jgi:ABC-type nitrate/sulfonate/bicarbonate transport system permease component